MNNKNKIKARVKLLKSVRRNTLFEKIVEHDIEIMALAKASGINPHHLYRFFDLPTGDELSKLESAIDVAILAAENEVNEELSVLDSNGCRSDLTDKELSEMNEDLINN